MLCNFQNFTVKFNNGESTNLQIYKMILTGHFLFWLDSSKNKQTELWKLTRGVKAKIGRNTEV